MDVVARIVCHVFFSSLELLLWDVGGARLFRNLRLIP